MNLLEKELIDDLIELKEKHYAKGIKAEFETEGTTYNEALNLCKLAQYANLDFTIKIGGCGAINDLYCAKDVGVNTILAPMIETSYALKKYVDSINSVFSEEEQQNIKFLINVETLTGYTNLEEIIKSEDIVPISGIVLGRDDMVSSLKLNKEDIDSQKVFEIAEELSNFAKIYGKNFVVGGCISPASHNFLKNLSYLSYFETRKVVFDVDSIHNDNQFDKNILKALNFEILWLKNKDKFGGRITKEDEKRVQILENRYKTLNQKPVNI
jgi:hypothetical protein